MADTRKIVKVFLASPGDLGDERRAAKSVVDEFNNVWADPLGYHVELVGWEDTVSVYGRPQETINRDLAQCELFIGMMWKRWGTPPDDSGVYSSGFDEEFNRSVEGRRSIGRPEISLFFKEIDPDLLRDPGDELKKVIAFKARIISEKKILFESFNDIREFEGKIRRCISRYVQRLRAEEAIELSTKSQMQQANTTAPESIVTESSVPKTPLTVEGTKFIRELITTTERNAGNGSFAATQVARFRLLGTIIAAQGNDEYTLGVHDSNILFANRSLLELSRRETLGLIFSALVDFPSENTPLWHWYAAIDGFSRSLLPQLSLAGSTAVRTGALFAMRLVAEPLTSSPPFSRSDFLNSWFSPKMPSALKAAALGYLGECGIEDDLPAIRQEFDRGDYQTTGAAVDAIVRVSLRESRDKAIKALYDLQPASIERNLLSALFGNSASIATNLISEGVSHKNPEIRRVSVRLLTERGALDVKEAERLLSDSDAIVRFEALQSLLNRGRSYSDGDVRQILVKSAEHGLGLLGSFHPSFDIAGEECFKQFREQRLRAMTDDELERLAVQETVLDRDAQFTLIERHFSIRGDELRKSVDNQFRAEFAAALNEMSKSFGSAADDLLSKTKSIEEQVRKGFTRKALDIICRNGDPQDLSRVRQLLGSGFVGYSDLDVEYLRKFGEWQDIPLVIDLVEGPSPIFTLTTAETKYRASARAIYSLGRSRLPELLALAMPSRLLSHLIVEASDKGFRLLDDPSIFALLFSQHDEVRKAAVLKCIRSLPKNRLKKLLDGYLSSDGLQYYNVIYWLDFGISAPRDRAVKAVQRTAARTWSG